MSASVSFPGASLTESLVRGALNNLDESIIINSTQANPPAITTTRLLQYCSYDHLNHELTLAQPKLVLASSYTIRKSLIRKHYLHRALSSYIAKQPDSVLATGVPRTWDIDIAWADELDGLFGDELWDLSKLLCSASERWYILKAGMADRGNGIRLFNSRHTLRAIFEEYDEQSDTESEPQTQDIITSQLRHFVIQEYLIHPLLVDPLQTLPSHKSIPRDTLSPYKFHLRAYCIASGALTLYLWPHILALFSTAPYLAPFYDAEGTVDLTPHLTNSALQVDRREASVRLFSELAGCSILSIPGNAVLAESDITDITDQTSQLLAEAFRAALASPVHFQPLPNAFELFGVDLLVTHRPSTVENRTGSHFQVHLLEFNAEPAIELTGPRLYWMLQDMFTAIARVCIGPFFGVRGCQWEQWEVGDTKEGLRKCLDVRVRGLSAW